MWARSIFTAFILGISTTQAWAQTAPAAPGPTWRSPAFGADNGAVPAAAISPAPLSPGPPAFTTPAVPGGASGINPFLALPPAMTRRALHVTAGSGTLPNEQGQVWREYDISPYTARVTTTKRPEQAIVDWILRETGYEVWHSEPLGILSASPRSLRVYHTPQMQAVVADIVDRFVASEAESRTFSLRIVTIDSPNWRVTAHRTLRPIPAQTPGVCAWLLPKEDAAVILGALQRRNDYREHSSPHLLVNNGQATVVSALRGRSFIRDVNPRPEAWQGYDNLPGQVDEGFSLEFNPLLSIDRRSVDAVIKCQIDQVEKLVPVMLEVPTQTSPRQRARVEVPQMSYFRFSERFRWPADQVLLLGLGVVALPVPVDSTPTVAGLPLPLPSSPPRADLLVIIESKGPVAETPGAASAGIPVPGAGELPRR
ncbi:MAG: hypothetical protein ABSG53_04545 [Thermoguttaceae bacterium]